MLSIESGSRPSSRGARSSCSFSSTALGLKNVSPNPREPSSVWTYAQRSCGNSSIRTVSIFVIFIVPGPNAFYGSPSFSRLALTAHRIPDIVNRLMGIRMFGSVHKAGARFSIGTILCLSFLSVSLIAQVGSAVITGVVTDPSLSPIPNTKLRVVNEQSGVCDGTHHK